MYTKRRPSWLKHLDFIILDWICVEFAFILSFIVRHPYFNFGGIWEMYEDILPVLTVIHVILCLYMEPYKGVLRRGYYEEMKSVLKYVISVLLVVILYLFINKSSTNYSRTTFCIFPCFAFIMCYLVRIGWKKFIRVILKSNISDEYVYLVTEKVDAKVVVNRLIKENYSTMHLKGIIIVDQDMAGEEIAGFPVVANRDNMCDFLTNEIVDGVIIHVSDEEQRLAMAEELLDMGAVVHISISDLASLPNAEVNRLNRMTVVTTSNNIATDLQLFCKRLIDIFFGLLGSIATVLVTIVLGPIIYMKSPGPIFFRQERVGKNGRKFKIWKYRTMYMDAEKRKAELMKNNKMDGLMFKMDEDPRIIGSYIDDQGVYHAGLGGLLRKLSIDELPQSFNILAGSMSVVGTRPPTSQEYEQYDPHHKSRLAMKPGLTGMWQVSGRSDITDFEEVVRLDTQYIRNWSLALDLKIIGKTFVVVLGRKGSV